MPQSHTKIYTHIVFSTKHREAVLHKIIQPGLYSYIGSTCNDLECFPVKIGGYYDHVHILCMLSKKVALIKLLEEIKKRSSKWMKTNGEAFHYFHWQDGYGAFSVNPMQLNIVAQYIEKQDEHHQKVTFQSEYRLFLQKYHADYDEQYVWD